MPHYKGWVIGLMYAIIFIRNIDVDFHGDIKGTTLHNESLCPTILRRLLNDIWQATTQLVTLTLICCVI